MERREFLKLLGLSPIPILVGSVGLAKLIHSIGLPNELKWRQKLSEKYTGRIITSNLMVDLVGDVLNQRGLIE